MWWRILKSLILNCILQFRMKLRLLDDGEKKNIGTNFFLRHQQWICFWHLAVGNTFYHVIFMCCVHFNSKYYMFENRRQETLHWFKLNEWNTNSVCNKKQNSSFTVRIELFGLDCVWKTFVFFEYFFLSFWDSLSLLFARSVIWKCMTFHTSHRSFSSPSIFLFISAMF